MHLKPAPPNAGIGLVRLDLDGEPLGNALAKNVIDVQRATTIACGTGAVHTVEHLLAALYACEVDNAIIEMDGPEPPVADGSSRPYVDLIEAAGVVTQNANRRIWRITEPVWVERDDSKLVVLPSDEFRMIQNGFMKFYIGGYAGYPVFVQGAFHAADGLTTVLAVGEQLGDHRIIIY